MIIGLVILAAVAAALLLLRRSVYTHLTISELPVLVVTLLAGREARARLWRILEARRRRLRAELRVTGTCGDDDWERRFAAQVGRVCATCGGPIGDERWTARVVTECVGRIPEDRDSMFWHTRCGEPGADGHEERLWAWDVGEDLVWLSLHSDDPGDDGAFELAAGGEYQRRAARLGSERRGEREVLDNVTMGVPGGCEVAYVGAWSLPVGGEYVGSGKVPREPFGSRGTYTVTQFRVRSSDDVRRREERV